MMSESKVFYDRRESDVDLKFSMNDDPFNAWREHICLVRSGALIEKNTWGEVTVFDFNHSSWLPCSIIRLLNGSPLSSKVKIHHLLALYVGEGLHDERVLKHRTLNLLTEIWDFLRCEEALDPLHAEVVRVFVFELDGRVHFLVSYKNDVSHLDYEDFDRGIVGLQGRHQGNIVFGFDSHCSSFHFLRRVALEQNFGKVEVFYQKTSKGVTALVFDEAGHLSMDMIPLADQRVCLPRHAYSLAICLKKTFAGVRNGVESQALKRFPLSFYWFLDDGEQVEIKDITSSMAKMMTASVKRLKPLTMILKPESLQGFLSIYSMTKQIPILDTSVNDAVYGITHKVGSMRDRSNGSYRIHLSDIKLDLSSGALPSMADLPVTTSDWMNLKSLLEKALSHSVTS